MRILTRGDLDGMTSSVFLTIAESITEIRFAHPKDVQDGKVPCTAEDIVVNLPYVPGCGMWFDHHVSEESKLDHIGQFKGRFAVAPSAARVVHDFYKKPEFDKYEDLLKDTDRLDSAQLTVDDVLNPKGWILLGYTLDPRTGLGPEFQIYFRWLVDYVKEVPVDKILQHPTVARRIQRIQLEQDQATRYYQSKCRLDGNVLVTDLRGEVAPPSNRFLVYSLFPQANVEVRILTGHHGQTVLAVGHSIFNRTSKVPIGPLMAKFGGGGHKGAGTCQLLPDRAEQGLNEILATLRDGAAPAARPAAKAAPKAKPAAKKKAAAKRKPAKAKKAATKKKPAGKKKPAKKGRK